MKKAIILLAAISVLAACDKDDKDNVSNEAARRKLEAWMEVNCPDAVRTDLGAYVLEEETGSGKKAMSPDSNLFVRLEFTGRELYSGKIVSYTGEETAKQLYSYDSTAYYGPKILNRASTSDIAGLEESISLMREGGRRKLIIPGWLNTYIKYDTAEKYYKKVSGTDMLYDFTLVEVINDLDKWECDSIERYIDKAGFKDVQNDTTGFYFIRTGKPSSDEEYASGDTFSLNYTGMRLDGQIFDTTIRDLAESAGVLKGSDYGTVTVTMADEVSEIKLGSSTVVSGFALALSKLHPGEKATVIFSSSLGYQSSEKGSLIPAYCPLRFDLEVVK